MEIERGLDSESKIALPYFKIYQFYLVKLYKKKKERRETSINIYTLTF